MRTTYYPPGYALSIGQRVEIGEWRTPWKTGEAMPMLVATQLSSAA
jgi:hypothetical protein